MTPDVDIETLRLLDAVDREGSIGSAARTLGITQPSASARLREFEARWRLRLVERSHRGTTLTENGRAVVSWARAALHEVDVMRSGMTALAEAARGELSVAASLTIAEFLMPRWLAELHERREARARQDGSPRVHLHVVNSEAVATLVRAGEVDVGFIESATTPSDLDTRLIGRDRLAVVVRPDHPWARRSTPLGIEALAQAAYVMREAGSGTRSTFETALRRIPEIALEAGSTTALLGGVRAGLGPAVVSRRAVAHELEVGRLVEVSHDLDLRRPLTAVWSRGRRLGDIASELLVVAARSGE